MLKAFAFSTAAHLHKRKKNPKSPKNPNLPSCLFFIFTRFLGEAFHADHTFGNEVRDSKSLRIKANSLFTALNHRCKKLKKKLELLLNPEESRAPGGSLLVFRRIFNHTSKMKAHSLFPLVISH